MFIRQAHRQFALECRRFDAEAEDGGEPQTLFEMADAWTL